MDKLIIVKHLYETLFTLDPIKSLAFFTKDCIILGKSAPQWIEEQFEWFNEHYFSKFNQPISKINVTFCDLPGYEKIIRVFNNKTLLWEDEFIFEGNLIKGTPYNIDCFGKIIFVNDNYHRGLTIQAPPGKQIVKILFKNPLVEYDFHNGATFIKDNFQVSNFKIENDNFLTKIEKINFYFSDGTKEVREIICRGKDFPFFEFTKHLPSIKNNKLILQQEPTFYYFIYIGNKNNRIEYLGQKLKNLKTTITVDFKITYARLCIDGTAFEYEVTCDN